MRFKLTDFYATPDMQSRYFGGSLELVSMDGWGMCSALFRNLGIEPCYHRDGCIFKASEAGRCLKMHSIQLVAYLFHRERI